MYVRALHNAIREDSVRYQPGQVFSLNGGRAKKMMATDPPMVREAEMEDFLAYEQALKKRGEDVPTFVTDYIKANRPKPEKKGKKADPAPGSEDDPETKAADPSPDAQEDND